MEFGGGYSETTATRSMLFKPRPTTSNAAKPESFGRNGRRTPDALLTGSAALQRSSSILSYGVRLRSLRGARWTSAYVLLAGILALAAAVRFWGIAFGLPHTQARPDETQIIDVTLYFLRGDFQPPFYDYPWLYMWVLTGLYLVYYAWGVVAGSFQSLADLVASWPINWEPFFLISRGAFSRGRRRHGVRGVPADPHAVG